MFGISRCAVGLCSTTSAAVRRRAAWKKSLHRCVIAALLTSLSGGCSRGFWRAQADRDAYRAVHQKELDGRWQVPRVAIQPDPRSRFYDPFNPDCTPLPPDDPAANTFMQCADGIPGYKSWHKLGTTLGVENPHWLAPFDLSTDMIDPDTGEYVGQVPTLRDLTLVQSIELSYIHSRDYQTQLEDLYLTALDLTFQRFQFQTRYLTRNGREPSLAAVNTEVPSTQSSLGLGSVAGISQALPSGGQWAVELANNTLWLFSGRNSTSTASVLSYSLVQPLALGAGRKIAMEGLTQAERDLLYQLRSLARFRKTLFTDTVGGNSGFLDLLEQIQGIRNQQGIIRRLERQTESLRALATRLPGKLTEKLDELPPEFVIPPALDGVLNYAAETRELEWRGAMSAEQAELAASLSTDVAYQRAIQQLILLLRSEVVTLDVAQLESSLRAAEVTLRQQVLGFRNSLDTYKISLGLPPTMQVTIDDSLIAPFQMIDSRLTDLEQDVLNIAPVIGELSVDSPPQAYRDAAAGIYSLLRRTIDEMVPMIDADRAKLRERLPSRLESTTSDEARRNLLKSVDRDQGLFDGVKANLVAMDRAMRDLAATLGRDNLPEESRAGIQNDMSQLREDLLKQTQSLQGIQIGSRVELIRLNKVEITLEDAIGLAMENRLDLMNQRAVVMDARRRQEIAANRLESNFNVRIEGDVRTPAGESNPVDFRGSSSSFRAGIDIDAPIDNNAQRNDYRAAQINYQRARRAYMLLEDRVKQQIRNAWRQLDTLEQNLETTRLALRIAALQYDQAVDESADPRGSVRSGSSSSSSSGSSRSSSSGVSGRNLVSALQDVLRAQNNLIAIWADYERARLNIFRDMDIMEIDADGVWQDEYYQTLKAQSREANRSEVTPAELPPAMAVPPADTTLLPVPTVELIAGSSDDPTFQSSDRDAPVAAAIEQQANAHAPTAIAHGEDDSRKEFPAPSTPAESAAIATDQSAGVGTGHSHRHIPDRSRRRYQLRDWLGHHVGR